MKTKHIISASAIGGFILMMSACSVTKPYQQPVAKTDSLYRDVNTTDTTSIASIPYTQLFTDAKLQTLL